jgi:hypothetical protein
MKNFRTIGLCDRCGFEYKLNSLVKQVVARKVTNTLVCSVCLDEDQPQWFPARIVGGDPTPIPNARPDPSEAELASGFGWGPVGGMGVFMTNSLSYDHDLEDRLLVTISTDFLVTENDELITQEDGSAILT